MTDPERLVEASPAGAGWFWPLIYTLALHAILFALLFISFVSEPQVPVAQPIIQATVYQLTAERPKGPPVPDQITAEAEKTKAAQREADQLEQQKKQREAEQQRKAQQAREAEQARAAEATRQAEAAKAAEALKQAEQQARQVAEQAKQQAAEAKRLQAQQKQREAEAAKKREAEQARQKAEAEAKAAEAKRQAEAKQKAEAEARQKREAEAKRQREAEEKRKKEAAEAQRKKEAEAKKQREAEEAKRRADEARKAKARADLIAAETERRRAQGDSERNQLIASLDDLFRLRVIENWRRPDSARNGMRATIRVSMLHDGTISQVVLRQSSGDTPFDNSTLAAIRSIGRIPEMQQLDSATFNARYRTRDLIFSPEDLER